MTFELSSTYEPRGDQGLAIKKLVCGLKDGDRDQVLLGVTGSGKTFTMAKVIAEVERPTLVLAHNKTLAAQLYQEFRNFFPNNAVEYFVSYYDYYQPEAYIASSNTYIEKESTIYINDIRNHVSKEVTIRGWLHNKRSSGKLLFLIVRDGTGYLQAVASKKALSQSMFQAANDLTHESSFTVTGIVRTDERAPSGYEMDISSLDTLQVISTEEEFPITPKNHGIEFLMDHRHLWIRSTRQRAILKIRHEIIKAVRDFLDDDGFTLCDTPVLTPAACEGTTTLFGVKYFDENAFLTQSGQLYNEATAVALGKVYCFGPTFRAEKSKTRRHLTEFWMVEPEVAYANLEDLMELSERFISFILTRVLERRSDELDTLERDVSELEKIAPPFPRISYDEAVEILQNNGSDIQWGDDFGGGDETVLSSQFDKPLIVHRYPSAIKAFYMEPAPDRSEVALCLDVLAPEGYGEIIGGGQRTANHELLLQRLHEHELSKEVFNWYLDLRKFGSVPHSGFGMGIERAVAWICKLDHVRETIPFPRMLNRLTP